LGARTREDRLKNRSARRRAFSRRSSGVAGMVVPFGAPLGLSQEL
jgi:hypothetical protein